MAERHKWADVIIAVANGLDVQYCFTNDGDHQVWHNPEDDFGINPINTPEFKWRIKPITIKIGDIEVPEPLRVDPKVGDEYWISSPDSTNLFSWTVFRGDSIDKRFVDRGLAHPTREDAVAHSKALIKISGGNV